MYPMPFRLVLLAASFLLLSAAGSAASPQLSAIMPMASKSLLLDVAKAGTRIVAAGEHGHILYSDDGGDNWIQASVPTTQMLTSVFFIDEKRGWAAGHDGLILVSDDAGTNWRVQRDGIAAQQQANLELREMAHDRVEQLEGALTNTEEPDRMALELLIEDARLDLEDADLALEEAVFASPLMDIWFQDRERGWAVGAFGTLLSTRDGGGHWTSVSSALENPEEFHLNAVSGDGSGGVFIAGEGGAMFRSLDGGSTWQMLPPFYEGSWFGCVYCPAARTLLVFGLRGHLYRSVDFGDQWQAISGSNSMTLAGGSADGNGNVVLVGAVGTVLHSRDCGQSFAESILPDRLSLSAALQQGGQLIVVGQGGIRRLAAGGGHE